MEGSSMLDQRNRAKEKKNKWKRRELAIIAAAEGAYKEPEVRGYDQMDWIPDVLVSLQSSSSIQSKLVPLCYSRQSFICNLPINRFKKDRASVHMWHVLKFNFSEFH